MKLLQFLQQNAEWMCAIAIVGFTAVQCWLAYQQNMQNIRLKRLELANQLDIVTSNFLGSKTEASQMINWLGANASNFGFLLNNKDRASYKKLCVYLYNYKNKQNYTENDMIEAIKQVSNIVCEIDMALGNANYGFVHEVKEFEPIK